MGILDNVINTALKVESITVSPEQMANLVETKLIPICSGKELNSLRKGMEKTWVLATGHGSSLRYYPSNNKDVKICLDFNMLTHQISKLSLIDLTDKTAKKEFVLPKGSNYTKQAQQMIMNKLLTTNSTNTDTFVEPIQTPPSNFVHPQQEAKKSDTDNCIYCGAKIGANSKFCPECGKSQKICCPKCNAEIKGTPKFCPECGNQLEDA